MELSWLRIRSVKCLQSFKLVVLQGFEDHKKSLERHFLAGRKDGSWLMNNIAIIFVVLDLIVLQNGNNLLKMNGRFGADL